MAAGAVLLASLQLAYALAAPQPPPSATPPPQIIDVHAHALCKVLRENVQPALAGLIQDDKDADVGRLAFEHLSADFLAHAKGAQAMDRLALANAGYALVHNLAAPAPAVTDEPAYVSVAGLPNSAYDAVSQANAHSQTLLSSTVYGKAADLLARQQRAIAWDERTTLAAILPAVTACGGASH
jgi:hypothetical protein